MFPLMDASLFVGALWDRHEGRVDPIGVTRAYAKAAEVGGATVVRNTRVDALSQRPDGTWDVRTDRGDIHAEHVVNAGGLWGREVGRMVDLELPLLAMAHQYIVTEPVPAVAEHRRTTGKELPMVVDFGGEIYMREEAGGVLLGTYEQDHRPWSPRVTPWTFGSELLQPEIDRIAPELEVGFTHYPVLAHAGIRNIVHGPFVFAPDGNPCIGPVKGLRNFWLAVGVMAGFCQAGGVGLALANWMTEGDPGMDIWAMDASRFGDWATMAYTNAKVRENYSRRFKITFPNEELPAGRPLHTSPLYDRYTAANAVWGASFGLEVALWFQEPGREPIEDITFRRSNAFRVVAEECAAVRDGVGITETSGFSKFRVEGEGATAWLDRLLTNRIPPPGRITLSPMLNHGGRLIGDLTVANLDRYFLLFGSGIAEDYYMRRFLWDLPENGKVRVEAARTAPRRALHSRASFQGRPAGSRRSVRGPRGLPVHGHAGHGHRDDSRPGRAPHVHRGSGLRDLGRTREPAWSVRPPPEGGRGARDARLRSQGTRLAAAGEGVRFLGSRIPAHIWSGRGWPLPIRRAGQGGFRGSRGGCS